MKVGMYGGKFLPFHNGHANMINLCAEQVDKLYVVVSSSERRDRSICARDSIKYMPGEVRASWIGRWSNSRDSIVVLNIVDEWGEEDYDWWKGAEMIVEAIPEKITHIFSSEPDYDKFFRNFYNAEHRVLDPKRSKVPISATEIRQNLVDNIDHLPYYVASFFVKKIAIVGTESCGKSTLAEKLAKYYKTEFVPEAGRYFCDEYSNQLTVEMFDDIAMMHPIAVKVKNEHANHLLFIDSEAVITQYYLNMYFGETSSLIDEIIKKQDFDLVLYLEPDVPWVDDGIRFAGKEEERKKNNVYLKELYAIYGIQYKIIDGDWEERFQKAVSLIDNLD